MPRLVSLVVLLVILIFDNVFSQKIKIDKVDNKDLFLSFMTKYENVRGDIGDIDLRSDRCETLKLWILQRHGTRYPDLYDIKAIRNLKPLRDEILENHKNGRGSLSSEELSRLEDWSFQVISDENEMNLTREGYEEVNRISNRFKNKFSALLGREYAEEDFYFQHTDKERTALTCRSFIEGIFGVNAHGRVKKVFVDKHKDFILMPSGGACPNLAKITNMAHQLPSPLQFSHSLEFQKVLYDVSHRLGFDRILKANVVRAIFVACGYETAWSHDSNLGTWCATLDAGARKVSEYRSDLVLYEQAGYANKVAETTGCGTVKDLWERFESTVENKNVQDRNQSVVVLVTHDTNILQLHTVLGLLKDDPLLNAHNFKLQGNRKWKCTNLVPFAANVAAVLQKCDQKYEVMMLRNEKPFYDFPGCTDGICSWSDFKRVVKPVAENCNFAVNNNC